MSAVLKPMSLEAFLDWESQQEFKYEFDGFQPVAMTGVSGAHSTIQANLMGLLFNRLRGHHCRAHGSDLKIQVVGRIRYPDAFIVCTPVSSEALVVHDPVVVFEILSPSTSDKDHFEKNLEYRDTPSIERYVMLEQSSRGATVFSRAGDDWVGHVLTGDDDLALPEVGITLSLAELHEGRDVRARLWRGGAGGLTRAATACRLLCQTVAQRSAAADRARTGSPDISGRQRNCQRCRLGGPHERCARYCVVHNSYPHPGVPAKEWCCKGKC